jgi:hypothetical protein
MARSMVDIQADLDAAYAARRSLLAGQVASVNSSKGSMQYISLQDVQVLIRDLEAERDQSQAAGSAGVSGGGIALARFGEAQ